MYTVAKLTKKAENKKVLEQSIEEAQRNDKLLTFGASKAQTVGVSVSTIIQSWKGSRIKKQCKTGSSNKEVTQSKNPEKIQPKEKEFTVQRPIGAQSSHP